MVRKVGLRFTYRVRHDTTLEVPCLVFKLIGLIFIAKVQFPDKAGFPS